MMAQLTGDSAELGDRTEGRGPIEMFLQSLWAGKKRRGRDDWA